MLLAYISASRSPRNVTRNEVPEIDALYDKYKTELTEEGRKQVLAELQKKIIDGSYNVPLLWYNRIVVLTSPVKGWKVTPSHYVGQNLADVWLDQ
jgi:peptide/nickel transport system substrate-binding protein